MSFNSTSFAKRLLSLDNTSASITGLSSYIQLQINNIVPLANTWDNEFRTKPADIQLAMIYVIDNVLQTVARKGIHIHPHKGSSTGNEPNQASKQTIDIYLDAFKIPLQKAIAHVCSNPGSTIRNKVERIVTIWKDRQVISSETAKEFEKAITDPEEVLFRSDAENPEALVLAAARSNSTNAHGGGSSRTARSSPATTLTSGNDYVSTDGMTRSSSPLTILENEILGSRVNDSITSLQPSHEHMMYEESYLQTVQFLRTMEKCELATAFSTEEFTNSGVRSMVERSFVLEDRLNSSDQTEGTTPDRAQLLSTSIPLVPSNLITMLTKHKENLQTEKRTREQMTGFINKFLKFEETEGIHDSKYVDEAKHRLQILRLLRKELKVKKQKIIQEEESTPIVSSSSTSSSSSGPTENSASGIVTSPVAVPEETEEGEVTVASMLAFATGVAKTKTVPSTFGKNKTNSIAKPHDPPPSVDNNRIQQNSTSRFQDKPGIIPAPVNALLTQITSSVYPSSQSSNASYNNPSASSSYSSASSSTGVGYPSAYPSYSAPPNSQYPMYLMGSGSVPPSSSTATSSSSAYVHSTSAVHPHFSSTTFKDTATSDDFGAIYNAGAARTEYYRAIDKQVSGGFGYGYENSMGGPPSSSYSSYSSYPGGSSTGVGLNLPPPNVRGYPSASTTTTTVSSSSSSTNHPSSGPSASYYNPPSSYPSSYDLHGRNNRR